ncbi:MAG: hypothetical protein PUD72_03680 [Oscillospiraceae bacterium]|nr:hypothetical protein [Oscillospiraceae bacterium]
MNEKNCIFNSRIFETEHAKCALSMLENGELDGLKYVEKNDCCVQTIKIIDRTPVVIVETLPYIIDGEFKTLVSARTITTIEYETLEEKLSFLLQYGKDEMFEDYPVIRELSTLYYYNTRKLRREVEDGGSFLRKIKEFIE